MSLIGKSRTEGLIETFARVLIDNPDAHKRFYETGADILKGKKQEAKDLMGLLTKADSQVPKNVWTDLTQEEDFGKLLRDELSKANITAQAAALEDPDLKAALRFLEKCADTPSLVAHIISANNKGQPFPGNARSKLNQEIIAAAQEFLPGKDDTNAGKMKEVGELFVMPAVINAFKKIAALVPIPIDHPTDNRAARRAANKIEKKIEAEVENAINKKSNVRSKKAKKSVVSGPPKPTGSTHSIADVKSVLEEHKDFGRVRAAFKKQKKHTDLFDYVSEKHAGDLVNASKIAGETKSTVSAKSAPKVAKPADWTADCDAFLRGSVKGKALLEKWQKSKDGEPLGSFLATADPDLHKEFRKARGAETTVDGAPDESDSDESDAESGDSGTTAEDSATPVKVSKSSSSKSGKNKKSDGNHAGISAAILDGDGASAFDPLSVATRLVGVAEEYMRRNPEVTRGFVGKGKSRKVIQAVFSTASRALGTVLSRMDSGTANKFATDVNANLKVTSELFVGNWEQGIFVRGGSVLHRIFNAVRLHGQQAVGRHKHLTGELTKIGNAAIAAVASKYILTALTLLEMDLHRRNHKQEGFPAFIALPELNDLDSDMVCPMQDPKTLDLAFDISSHNSFTLVVIMAVAIAFHDVAKGSRNFGMVSTINNPVKFGGKVCLWIGFLSNYCAGSFDTDLAEKFAAKLLEGQEDNFSLPENSELRTKGPPGPMTLFFKVAAKFPTMDFGEIIGDNAKARDYANLIHEYDTSILDYNSDAEIGAPNEKSVTVTSSGSPTLSSKNKKKAKAAVIQNNGKKEAVTSGQQPQRHHKKPRHFGKNKPRFAHAAQMVQAKKHAQAAAKARRFGKARRYKK